MGTLSFWKVEMPFWASFRARVWGVEIMRAPGGVLVLRLVVGRGRKVDDGW